MSQKCKHVCIRQLILQKKAIIQITVQSSALNRMKIMRNVGILNVYSRYDDLSKTVLQDTWQVRGRRGRHRKCWMDNIKEWTSLPCQYCSQGTPIEKTGRGSQLIVLHVPPTTQSVKGLNWTELWWVGGVKKPTTHLWCEGLEGVSWNRKSYIPGRWFFVLHQVHGC